MRAVDVIRTKRDGGELSAAEIEAFVAAATHGTWPDYQLSALLMAIWLRGMTPAETALLTGAMARSGKRHDWSALLGSKVGKHSTGGVGDKTSLVTVPLAAACGVLVPKMSGRGLGNAGGTLDKLEAIPGFRVTLGELELREALARVGAALIGQTAGFAPADKKLYALRDVTGTVESIPLITASVLSKKLTEGIDALVVDVKAGRGAYMKTLADARELARLIVAVGAANGLKTEALITAMDVPLGCAVGNALEVVECIETLKGNGPSDLQALSIELAARMVRLAGLAVTVDEATVKVRSALISGAGLEKFRALVAAQGGDPRIVDDYSLLPTAPRRHTIVAERAGYVADLHAESIAIAAMRLGAGRNRAEDGIDHAVGVVVRAPVGAQVAAGEGILEVHYRDEAMLGQALPLLTEAISVGSEPPPPKQLIYEVITS
jgi:pyrimidine-nucleoside phosphorylase